MVALVCALALGLFAWQRGRSSFRAIGQDRAAAAAVAARHELTLACAMALRDLTGKDAPAEAWEAAAALFRAERVRLGDALAAIVVAGDRPAAEAARSAATDADAAWQRFATDPRAVPGLRFLQLRERFATHIRPRG